MTAVLCVQGVSENPRVLHLISSSGFLGAENVVLELSKETAKQGYWVTIGILENRNNLHMELAKKAREEGMKVQIFPCKGRFDTKTIKSIRNFIDREQPNILHSHGYKSNFYAWRALSGRKIPWIITNHGKRIGIALSVYNRLNIVFMKKADKVVAVSQVLADEMKQQGISSTRMHIIDNGVNLERFANQRGDNDLRKSFGLDGNHKLFGTIGSLTEEKGHVYLIEAAQQVTQKYPECRFLIVGDGRQRQVLEERTADLGLSDKVIFTGSRKDVPEILAMLDAFVLPSLKEGLPMALLEAMASKVPVIATSVGAIPQVLENGINGLLIPPKNSDSIAEAINTMLSDGNSAKEMALRGFEKVRDHYSAKIMFEKYLTVYHDLMA
jgi:glycosyltransferase involved in cell wall biosynthesis